MSWRVGESRTFRWAPVHRWLVLLADGWMFEDVDQRYFTVLMSRAG